MPKSYVRYGPTGACRHGRMAGYSLVEIIIALTVIMIMTAIALPYFYNYSRLYKSEDQAFKLMDLMREANQLAMTRRRVIRLEMDRTNIQAVVVRLIDENGTDPDVLLKTVPLEPLAHVRMDVAPAGFVAPPPNYPTAVYSSNVWSARFTSNGSVVNAADLPISTTIYSWRPNFDKGVPFNPSDLNPPRKEEVRAITIFGGSGAVRYWKYNGTAFVSGQ